MDVTEPANCTCLGLRKAARAVTQMYDQTLKPAGLRSTQFSLLVAAERAGPRGIGELAELLVMDRTTLTRNLKPLLVRGLLERAEGADRACSAISGTPRRSPRENRYFFVQKSAYTLVVENLNQERNKT
jgi:hypothetical protein